MSEQLPDAVGKGSPSLALPGAASLLQRVFDTLTDHLCVLDENGRIVAVNRAWRDFAAANPAPRGNVNEGANYFAVCETAIGVDAFQAQEALRGLRAVARGEILEFALEYPCHSPDQRRWFELRAARLKTDDSGLIVVTHRNMTRRKQAELALRASEERYRAVVEDQTEVICRFRQDGTFTFVNDVYYRFFGKRADELIGQKWQPKALPEDLPHVEAQLRLLSPSQPVVVIENRVFASDGQMRWMQFVNRGFFDAQGRLTEIQSVGRDITERKHAEEALSASEQRYRTLFEKMDEGFCMIEMLYDSSGKAVDYRFEEINPAFEEHTGLQQALGRTIRQMVPDLDAHWFEIFGEVVQTGKAIRVQSPAVAMRRYYDVFAFRVGGDGSQRVGILFNDITARKQAENALRESEDRFHSLFEASLDAALLTAPDGRVLAANAAACRMFGRSAGELIRLGRSGVMDLSDPRLQPALQERDRTGRFVGELRFLRSDGTKFPGEISSAVFRNQAGELRTSMVIRDITKRQQVEAELSYSREALRALTARLEGEREEARTRIAREIHDELGHAMTDLKLDLAWLDRRLAEGGFVARSVIRKRIAQMSRRVDSHAQSVRRIATELRPPVLDALGLSAAIEWQAREFEERTGVSCTTVLPETLPFLSAAQTTALFRAFQEILSNITRHAQATRAEISLAHAADRLDLRVRDNGRGFAPTEPVKPTSLGLLGMRERASALGGEVQIESAAGQGTRVIVSIPVPSP